MPSEITHLDYPIDVMSLIHKAIRAEARLTRRAAEQLEMGGGFKTFMQVFYRWAMALEYHEETEYKHVIPHLPQSLPSRHNEIGHKELLEGLEELQVCLHEELGRTTVIPRTQRQLFGKVISLLIVQADLLEDEEENFLPAVRQQISKEQQMEMAHRLLFDLEADEPHWVLDWIAEHLTEGERRVLAEFAARFDEPSYALSALLSEHAATENEGPTPATTYEGALATEKASFEYPIDVMFLLHKALSVDAWRAEAIAERLAIGEDLQMFRQAFDSWIKALNFHADMEDMHMTPRLTQSRQTRENEEAHALLERRITVIQAYLQEVGDEPVTVRIRRRLFGQVVALRIEQDDHFEEEEASILPIIRDDFSREQQIEMVGHLLVDPNAAGEQSGWVLDWLRQDLTDVERQSLDHLTASFNTVTS